VKTSVQIDSEVVRRAAAQAAKFNTSVESYVEHALKDRLNQDDAKCADSTEDWGARFEQLLTQTNHFRIGSLPTRDEMNQR
jgi:hypothetical protein